IVDAIEVAAGFPRLVDTLFSNRGQTTAKADRRRIEGTRNQMRIAGEQHAAGNPVVYRMASVGLWSAAEAFITDLLLDWLTLVPQALRLTNTRVALNLGESPIESPEELHRMALRLAIDNAAGKPERNAYFTPLHTRLRAFCLL